MNTSILFIRAFYVILSVLFLVLYQIGTHAQATTEVVLLGVLYGLLVASLLIALDHFFKRSNLRAFNITVLGLFFGYLMGFALNLIFSAILEITSMNFAHATLEIIKIFLYLFGTYLGVILTLRAADELHVSIPFIRLSSSAHKKRDILVDFSALSDPRLFDLGASGLLDNHLIIARFLVRELYSQLETGDEGSKIRAKRSLDLIKKLEAIPDLKLRYNETDFTDVKELNSKLLRLARLLDANILTADSSKTQIGPIEGIRIINIHLLSHALKPLMQAGETLKIKIQRFGKESRQGVGYLDDGTMVVVNGGGDFIGEIIKAKVLSVKHTSSGRMIFCNASDEEHEDYLEDHYDENDFR